MTYTTTLYLMRFKVIVPNGWFLTDFDFDGEVYVAKLVRFEKSPIYISYTKDAWVGFESEEGMIVKFDGEEFYIDGDEFVDDVGGRDDVIRFLA